MNSIQPRNHELNLTTISPLKLTVKLLILIFTEIIYSLRHNTPAITENSVVQLIIITILSLLLHSNINFSNI